MRDYRQYQLWQQSHELVRSVYHATERFPKNELYSLTSQVRRAACSIPMNVAEGCGKSTDVDFARFLDISAGSASELDYQLLLSRDLGFLDDHAYGQLSTELSEIRRMLTVLIQRVRQEPASHREKANR